MKKNRNLLWGISVLPALLVMPAMADENKYDMSDGDVIVLTENETITNTITTENDSQRKTGILASGTNVINTGDYTLTVNSGGATARNYIFNTTNGTDFTFIGNLDATLTSVGNEQGRGIRLNSSADVVFNGSVKVDVTTENAEAYGSDAWPNSSAGAHTTFLGTLTDIRAKSTGNQAFGIYGNLSGGGVSSYVFGADFTKIVADGYVSSSSKTATAVWSGYSDVTFNGDAEIIAKNSVGTASGIRMLSDTGKPKATAYLNGNNISVSILDSIDGWGLLASGNSEIISTSNNLQVNVDVDSTSNKQTWGIAAQYGGRINLKEGTNTTVNVSTADGWTDGVVVQGYSGLPGQFISKGNLNVNVNGKWAHAVRVVDGSPFSVDQLTASATATSQAMGAFITDSSDVVIGAIGKTSSLKGVSENGLGVGLYMSEGEDATTIATLKGTMLIQGSSVGVYNDGGTLINEANLTVLGGMYNADNFTNNANLYISGAENGALYNGGVITSGENASWVFLNNSSTESGGAIYNEGMLTLAGMNIFSGNTANGVANDIFNTGSLNIASGTTTIDGGIDGTGTLTIADGAILNIGTASVTQNNITLNGTMLATLRSGDDAQIDVATFDDESTGSLNLAIRNEGTYHVFGTDVFGNVNMESSLYDLAWSADNKDVVATMKSVADIASDNNLTAETAVAVSGLAASSSEKLNDLAMVIQEKLATKTDETRTEVEHAKAAIHPETESVVQSVSSSVQSTVTSLAANRMALPTIGRSGGDVKMTSGGVWVNGIFNKTKQNDSFNGYTRGFAAGLDGTINKVWTIGAGYAFAHSDIAGTARDTEIDSSSLFVYGQYKPSAWYVNAVANYTMSDYTEKGAVFGVGIAADYDVDSFGANIATGYDFAGGITPELGLRYMHINSSDYISSLDIKNELADADYLTASLGTKYAFDIKASKRLNLRPELHYAVKYDLLSDAQVATVAMPGVNAYSLNGERLSRVGGEFGIGMGIVYRGAGISLNYDIEAREDYTSQTGRVKFRYNF